LWHADGDQRMSVHASALLIDSAKESFLSTASLWEFAIKMGQENPRRRVVSNGSGDFDHCRVKRRGVNSARLNIPTSAARRMFVLRHGSSLSRRWRFLQPLKLRRLDDAPVLPVGDQAVGFVVQTQGELLGNSVAPATLPRHDDIAIVEFHIVIIECPAALRIDDAQFGKEPMDGDHIEVFQHNCPAVSRDGGGVEMSEG
jgi:hypothetical protein